VKQTVATTKADVCDRGIDLAATPGAVMFGDGFEQAAILCTGPDGLTRVISRHSWSERESFLVNALEAELVVLRRWVEFHREMLGATPSWGTWAS
jgi:hypothetical protein